MLTLQFRSADWDFDLHFQIDSADNAYSNQFSNQFCQADRFLFLTEMTLHKMNRCKSSNLRTACLTFEPNTLLVNGVIVQSKMKA